MVARSLLVCGLLAPARGFVVPAARRRHAPRLRPAAKDDGGLGQAIDAAASEMASAPAIAAATLPANRRSLALWRVGWCSWWSQVILSVISAVVLVFARVSTPATANSVAGALGNGFLFASLGVYPRAGTDLFFVGSPRVASASLRLNKALPGSSSSGDDDGGDASTSLLQIITHNNSATRVFVEALLVNGEPHRSPFLTRSDLTRPGGSVLEFFMSDQPVSSLCPLGSSKFK